ncbi:cytochrome P450 [Mycena albidolilacea]|uniref:NADPH--hemoprotein reductase n=1 Tax=Mycena albidolilacea TaxID=1033008 RepID=A0AAD7ACP5_9AGAR|nr:cytochrome P450 [Mycena albidolilacea]
MPAIIFYLHGTSAQANGITIDVQKGDTIQQLRKTVAEKFSIALPATISFHVHAAGDMNPSDLKPLDAIDAILGESSVSILVSGKKVRPVPGPSGGIPFIGGYSEIYPDFLGNYKRLLQKYGHIVHSVYLTDDPDCAGVVLSEGEFFSKQVGENHPLFPLKMSFQNGLFTADSNDPEWSTSHKFMMTAMGAKAMRNYARTMDHTANRLVECFEELLERGKSFDAFSWGLRAAAQTIGEVGVGIDFKMLDNADSSVADIFTIIAENVRLSQTLFRRGRIYRALPNPERSAQKATERDMATFVDVQKSRVLETGTSKDMPYQEAAVSTNSLLDYMLHATDEEGKKMEVNAVHNNILTFLAAGQVTTSSALAWLWFCLATFPAQARKLYTSLIAAGLRADSKEITPEQLAKLEYLDWFIKEMQRLYNPPFQPTRQAQKDVIMPGGILVPKGAQVTVALHALMINPEHWKDPLTFNPERWGTEEVRKRHQHAYIPFAAGARGCIGFNFALQEIKIILARVVLNFQVENTTEGAVIYDPEFPLYRPLNFSMKLHKQVEVSAVTFDKPIVEEKIQAPQPSVGTKNLPKFWAVHASNTGSCEGMAGDAAAKARQLGFADVQIVPLADSPLSDPTRTAEVAAGSNFFVICVATYNGEPPDAGLAFSETLDIEMKAGNDSRFSGINFCVFGAGNTQWGPTYQAFPNKVDADLAALGGNRIFEKGSGDANADQDGDFTDWSTRLWAATAANFGIDINLTGAGSENNILSHSPEYAQDSVKVIYLPTTSSGAASVPQPPVPEFVQATVRSNIELVDEDTPKPRSMRLLTIDIPQSFTYREGDHMDVFPENDPVIVEHLLTAFDFVADAVFMVKDVVDADVNPKSLAFLLRDRHVTLRELLTYYADLSGPLQRNSLLLISSFLPVDAKFQSLRETLTDAGSTLDPTDDEFFQKNRNFAQLIINYPMLAQAFDLPKLLTILRATQPRRYSIASSPLADSRVAKLFVGVEDSRVADYEGLCSGFLKRAGAGHILWVRHRSSQDSFHLPTDPTIPVTMVAAGTGISAFLGFMEHRRALGMKTEESGGQAPFRLFYGISRPDMAALKGLVHGYVDDGTMILETVYSSDNSARRFAQQLLTRDGVKVWNDLSNNGRVYVCGSAARVGAGVRNSLMHIGEQIGGVADASGWLAGLKKEGRYSEDIFG